MGWSADASDRRRARREYYRSRSRTYLRRAAKKDERLCLRCDQPFRSVGPHNRMCDYCRSAGTGMI